MLIAATSAVIESEMPPKSMPEMLTTWASDVGLRHHVAGQQEERDGQELQPPGGKPTPSASLGPAVVAERTPCPSRRPRVDEAVQR